MTVRVKDGQLANSIVESTLTGVGVQVLGRGAGAADVEVVHNNAAGIYQVRGRNGEELVQVDAATGRYTVAGPFQSALTNDLRISLDWVGAIVRGTVSSALAAADEAVNAAGFTAAQLASLEQTWRLSGLSQTRIDTYSDALREAQDSLSQAGETLRGADDTLRTAQETLRGAGVAAEVDAPRTSAGSAELFCEGNQEILIENRVIEAAGIVLDARGNCEVYIISSKISSGSVAIRASGNAEVEIENSTIDGAQAAVIVEGNAEVSARGSDIFGPIRQSGLSDFKDLGGNEFKR
jgi:hypothetical protein